MFWRVVQKTEIKLLEKAALFERSFPQFFRDSSNTWTMDENDVLRFYQKCSTLIGIFNKKNCLSNSLVGLVYFEFIGDGVYNVHLDVQRGACSCEQLISVISQIRDYQFLNGVRICMAWALKRNKQIQQVLTGVGFLPTFLEMRHGFSHNKVLKWHQFCIARG